MMQKNYEILFTLNNFCNIYYIMRAKNNSFTYNPHCLLQHSFCDTKIQIEGEKDESNLQAKQFMQYKWHANKYCVVL